jgi:hypothetical protein
VSNTTRVRVEQAIYGAARRLEHSECQRIFIDFQDRRGRPLAERLIELQTTAIEYLMQALWFVDATSSPRCAGNQLLAAFTRAGSHVVFLCARNLLGPALSGGSPQAEIAVIHELLHSLGLEENPPTSREITQQVIARCGR